MARGHGRILTSIWDDADFLALDEREQRLYLFLISQPNLNHAGLLDLTLRRWSRKARGLTSAELEKLLQALEAAHFIVMDDDTEELLIRSFVRNDGVWKQPKVMGAMVSGAMEISSWQLRSALLAEVDRIPLDELSNEPGARGLSIRTQVAEHIETLRKAFGNPPTDPHGRGSATPSEPLSNPPHKGDAEGGAKASTRGRAPASHAHSPAPAPAPAPAPNPGPVEEGSADADSPTELIVVDDSDFVGAAEAAPQEPEPVTAQTIVAEWLDRCTKRPPSQTIGQTSKQIKKLLEDGIEADDIRRGLAKWMARGSGPSAIPSFVNEAMNAQPQQRGNVFHLSTGQALSGTDARVAGWLSLPSDSEQEVS
ncbi:hypothetical protein [Streptomyces noursei]|uniref:hypothetical protein n=1 Tax=Streptomyces noursei TaxID=1971 RepID=UPI0035DD4B10